MKIKILYEDKDILAIDKPSGLLVHPSTTLGTGPVQKTILDIFKKKYPKLEIAHRLDKETSGVMLLAKNKKAREFLKKQFSAPALEMRNRGLADRQNRINKVYVAIVNGWVKDDYGIINKPIGRSPRDFRRHLAGRGARGELREAITEYKVLKRFAAQACENFSSCALPVMSKKKTGGTLGEKNFHKPALFTYLEVKPKTGRTHQIRVHLKYLNHPIACDSLYNPNGFCPKGISRTALHAKSIEFKNLKGEMIKVESKVPKEFSTLGRSAFGEEKW